MNTQTPATADERTAVAYKANTWSLNVVLYALLLDIIYRSVFLHETAWDLFLLLSLSGVISGAYMARHKVFAQVFGWKLAFVAIVSALIVAAISFFMAGPKAM